MTKTINKENKKQLTMNDLLELKKIHLEASSEEAAELWRNTEEVERVMLSSIGHLGNKKNESWHYYVTDRLLVDSLFDHEIESLIFGLKKYNITSFIFIGNSSITMNNIITLLNKGYRVVGPEVYKMEEKKFKVIKDGVESYERAFVPVQGLLFERVVD